MSVVSGKGFRPIRSVQSGLSFLTNRKDGLAKLYFIVISCTDQLFFLRDDLLWGKNGGVFIDQRNQLVIYDLVYGSGVRF